MGGVLAKYSYREANLWPYSYRITVIPGPRKHLGSCTTIKLRLFDKNEATSEIFDVNLRFKYDLEKGHTCEVKVADDLILDQLAKVEITMDSGGYNSPLYADRIEVEDPRLRKVFVFPVNRWLSPGSTLFIQHLDAVLPQDETHKEQREKELAALQELLQYHCRPIDGFPPEVKEVEDNDTLERIYEDEHKRMDNTYIKFALLPEVIGLRMMTAFMSITTLQQIEGLYGYFRILDKPLGVKHWRKDSWFGSQRLMCSNTTVIKRCTEIPDNFGVTEDILSPFLEGLSLNDAMEAKRLYICDYKVMLDLETKENRTLPRPLALFFVNDEKDLVPIAIQLFQEKGEENPVFLPSDDPNVWLFAKMWYNVADSNYHQTVNHLGNCHHLMEGVYLCTHRMLSPSHPVFRLLAPHMLSLLPMNRKMRSTLLEGSGPFTIDTFNSRKLIGKIYNNWRLNVEGHLPNDLKNRGVDDVEVLPNYPYRDDGLLIWNAIRNYVEKIVSMYYDSPESMEKDTELQQWIKELSAQTDAGGVGLQGVSENGKCESADQLVDIVSAIILRGSVGHGSANFTLYDDFAFCPNYPQYLNGEPPKTKEPIQEITMVKALPSIEHLMQVAALTKVFGQKCLRPIGDFDITYLHDPRAKAAATEFREEIVQAAKVVRERNETRKYPYTVLDPLYIPNGIHL